MAEIERDTYLFVRDLAHQFADAGEELYLVGGALRDRLLGHMHPDLDFATSARPPTILRLVEEAALGSPYRVGEAYGTIGVRSPRGQLEFTTYRSEEQYQRGSRKPAVTFGDTLAADLSRRDFTVNAMAYDPIRDMIIDPMQGAGDLARRTLRAVGDPEARFADDPLRLLRAVRFATRFDLALDPATESAIRTMADQIPVVSQERIAEELRCILLAPQRARGMNLMWDLGLVAPVLHELVPMKGLPYGPPRAPTGDLWDHVMSVLDRLGVEPSFPLAFAGLDHFPTFENVAFRLCRSDGLLLFVELVDPVQPFLVEADSLIVFAQAGNVTPIGRPREADIVGSRIQLLPAYDDVRLFLPLVTFVADQRGARGSAEHRRRVGIVLNRLVRCLLLDEQAYQELRATPAETVPAIVVVVVAGLLAGLGGFIWTFVSAEQVDHTRFLLRSLLLGSVLQTGAFFLWTAITARILQRIFALHTTYSQLVRVMGYAFAPVGLQLFIFPPALDQPIGIIALAVTLYTTAFAVQACSRAMPAQAFTSCLAGFAVFCILLGILGNGDWDLAPGIFALDPNAFSVGLDLRTISLPR